MDITWDCKKCGHKNEDVYELTAFPECGRCDELYLWDDVLTPEQMQEANKVLEEV